MKIIWIVNCLCIVKEQLLSPPLVAHTPSVACAALLPHLHHAGKSLNTRLTGPQHGHLLVSTNIWPVHTKWRRRWTGVLK